MIFEKNNDPYMGQNPILRDGKEIAPGIFVYEEVINNCQQIIDFALLDSKKWRDAEIGIGEQTNKKIRNNKVLDIPPLFSNDVLWFLISQTIWLYANKYGFENNISFSNMEPPQILHYFPDEGFYAAHADSGPGLQRVFSAILYLNDVEDGGETYFNKFDISIKPKSGRLAIFPANYVYTHEARTPKSNEKFAIVTWFNPIF